MGNHQKLRGFNYKSKLYLQFLFKFITRTLIFLNSEMAKKCIIALNLNLAKLCRCIITLYISSTQESCACCMKKLNNLKKLPHCRAIASLKNHA